MKNLFKLNPMTITIMVIIVGFSAYFAGVPFLDQLELITIDLRFSARGPVEPSSAVVLVAVDEKSLANEGNWPWPRKKMAEIITKLSDAGAEVITFDIVWSEPDDQRGVDTVNDIQKKTKTLGILEPELHQYLAEVGSQTDHDKLLADAIRRSEAKIVLGYFLQTDPESASHLEEEALAVHRENVLSSRYVYVRHLTKGAMDRPFPTAVSAQSNISVISDAAEYSGTFNFMPDPDGVMRRAASVFKFQDDSFEAYAPISMMSVSAFLDSTPHLEVDDIGLRSLEVGDLSIPTDEFGRIMINYRGGVGTFPTFSATDVLQGEFSKDAFQGRIVIVGVTATGIYDIRQTPFDTIYPGLEIHANLIDTILTGDFLEKPDFTGTLTLLAMLLGAIILGFVLPKTGPVLGGISSAGLFFGYILLCQYVFTGLGWVLDMIYPLLIILLVYVAITAYKYLSELEKKRFIRGAFSTYLAPAVVKQLVDSPDKLALGGEERVITAFFSDVQGFTSISEKLTATELVELLNEFLTEMTDIILKYEGTVDKFEGDAVIALFGAPIDIENHGEIACRASLDMQAKLAQLREKWKSEGRPELQMRIGMYTGPAVVGNMGSENRMDYTMMGNTVNTAARLEGVNKIYGMFTMIGETTYEAAGDAVVCREIDSVNVVGKQEPVKVYELVGYPDNIDDPLRKMIDCYHKGLDAYRLQDWDAAAAFFSDALIVSPNDGPSKTMLMRCEEFKSDPPDRDWNGTYSMRTK